MAGAGERINAGIARVAKKVGGLVSEGLAERTAFEENIPKGREAEFKAANEKLQRDITKKKAAALRAAKPSGPYSVEERNLLSASDSLDSGG